MWVGVDQRLTFNCISILLFCNVCVSGAQLAGSSSSLSSSEDYTQILEIQLRLSGLGASSFPLNPLVTPTLLKTSPTKSGSASHIHLPEGRRMKIAQAGSELVLLPQPSTL